MNVYLIRENHTAIQVRNLLRLNAECARLHWSKTIEVPEDIVSAAETLEAFVEEKVYKVCTEKTLVSALSEEAEAGIMRLIRKHPELKETIGTGVVMAGAEAENAANILAGTSAPEALVDALHSGMNVVLF